MARPGEVDILPNHQWEKWYPIRLSGNDVNIPLHVSRGRIYTPITSFCPISNGINRKNRAEAHGFTLPIVLSAPSR